MAGGKIGPEFLLAPTLIRRPLAFKGGVGVRSFSDPVLLLAGLLDASSAEVDPCSSSPSAESQAGTSTSKPSELEVESSVFAIEVTLASSGTGVSRGAMAHQLNCSGSGPT